MEIATLKKRLRKERKLLIAVVIIGLLTLNFLASRHFFRLDLTGQKIYSLAPATKKILFNLEDIVTIRLYFTRDLPPGLTALQRDVEDLLEEFKTYSGEKVRIEYHDPQTDPMAEQKVQMMGIPPVEVNVIKKDKQELARIYLGLTVGYGTNQETLPVIQSLKSLEYRLAAALVKVTQQTKPKIGWIADPMRLEAPAGAQPVPNSFSIAHDYLAKRYEITTIDEKNLEALDPTQLGAVLYTSPRPLTEKENQALQNYFNNGGKLLLFVNRFSAGETQGLQASAEVNPFENFFKELGVTLEDKMMVDQANAMASFTGGIVTYHLPYPYWVKILPEGFDPAEPMVSELQSLVLPWTSPFAVAEPLPEGIHVTKLMQSSPTSVKTEVAPAQPLDPQSAGNALANQTGGPQPLGLLVTKKLADNKEGKLLLVGTSRFLQNGFLEQFEENVVFLENGVDVFATGSELVGIRSKTVQNQPIPPLSDLGRTVIKAVNMGLSPFLLLGIGGWIYWRRKCLVSHSI